MMLFPMPPQSSLDLKIAIESDTVLTSSDLLPVQLIFLKALVNKDFVFYILSGLKHLHDK